MVVSIRKAFKNVISDDGFLLKYTVLVVLSFCVGLLSFAMLAKNYSIIVPVIIIAVLATTISVGYDITYIKDLIENENAKMPEWNDPIKFMMLGLKFMGAVILFAIAVTGIILLCSLIILLLSMCSKLFLCLFSIPIIMLILVEIYILIVSPAMVYAFIDTEFDIFSIFNLRKIFSYLGINYFIALFSGGFLVALNGIIAGASTFKIKYALLYIIPLMIAPFLRMGTSNLFAQAYTAHKNNEEGSLLKMFIFMFLCVIFFAVMMILSLILGYISSNS